MLKQIIYICLLFASVLVVKGQDLKSANDLYGEGEFQEALVIYTSLIDSGLESSSLFFNAANAYYKLGDLPNSLLNYERAKLLAPKDNDIQFNLSLTQKLVVDKIELVDEIFFEKWVRSFRSNFHTDIWAWLSIGTFLIFISGLFIYSLFKSSVLRKFGFYLGGVALFLSIVSAVFSYQQKKLLTERTGAIIFAPTVTVKSSPDESGNDLFILHEGSKVNVRDSVGSWWEIVMGDGNVGWIPKDALKKI